MGSEAPPKATKGELLPSRFRKPITDAAEIKKTLSVHSVLTEADLEAEQKKKRRGRREKALRADPDVHSRLGQAPAL